MGIFEQEVKERSKLAQQARHVKKGSKTKYVSLPSDHMTEAEWKRRNGQVMTYNLSRPMRWEEFNTMPERLQKEYLAKLKDQFHATNAVIGAMFGVSDETVRKAVNDYGIRTAGKRGNPGTKMTQTEKDTWYAWIAGGPPVPEAIALEADVHLTAPTDTTPTIEPVTGAQNPDGPTESCLTCNMTEGTLSFNDNAKTILEFLSYILNDRQVSLTVNFKVEAQ